MSMEIKLQEALRNAGIPAAERHQLVLDGKLHRFDIDGRVKGKKHGWLIGHSDGGNAFCVFGDWVSGIRQKWCSRSDSEMSTAQRLAVNRRFAEMERVARIERNRMAAIAVKKAASMLAKAGPVDLAHPYVMAKRIVPYGACQLRDLLLVPVVRERVTISLQIISDRGKTFLSGGETKGGHLVLGHIKNAPVLLMCEGWATGCTLRQASGLPVVVCFSAPNLVEVARRLSGVVTSKVLVCGDDDFATAGNPGKAAAMKAASLISGARYITPCFTRGTAQS